MTLHPDVRVAIIAEVANDPASRGYAGKSHAAIAALMSESWEIAASPTHVDVSISSVEGYMRLRRHIVQLRRWVKETPQSDLRDFAEELLDMIAAANVRVFQTGDDTKRPAILGAFAALAAVGAGGFSAASVADLTAMTVGPPGEPIRFHPRWIDVVQPLTREAKENLPNIVTADMIAEALT